MLIKLSRFAVLAAALVMTGCASQMKEPEYDYSAFRESKPSSILVLPPLNASVEPSATNAVLAQATLPLAESGYYVVPVGVMSETFRQNGLDVPEEIHQVPMDKLREIFGADAALYMTVTQYGSSYQVLASVTTVAIDAELIDLRNGAKLWKGQKTVSQSSNDGNSGLLGMLIQAVVEQVINTVTDSGYAVADQTNRWLLSAGQPGGLLYGPRSPHYEMK